MKRLHAWLGVLLVFLFGAVCGAVLTAGFIHQKTHLLMTGGNGKVEDPIVTKLRHELHLDAAQQAQVKQIVVDTRAQMEGIKQTTQPEMRAALVGGEDQVRAVLRPEQAARFDKLLQESHDKWKNGQ